MPLAPVSTVPDRLLHTLKREAMARRDIIGPFEWLSYAQDAVHAYCASSGHEFRGYHPHSRRSLVALVGRGHHDVPLYTLKIPYRLSATAAPKTIIAAMVDWGRRGLAPWSEHVGGGVLSHYIDADSYFLRTTTQRAVTSILRADLSFDGGSPQTLAQRLELRHEGALAHHDRIMDLSPAERDRRCGTGAAEAAATAMRELSDAATYLLDRHRDSHTICHGDLAASNVIDGPNGPRLIDPEPHYGPREIDLGRLMASAGEAAYSPSDTELREVITAARLDPTTAEWAAAHSAAGMTLYRLNKRATSVV